MSVDFYACDVCGESRYEEFVGHCTDCNHSICTRCVTNDDLNSDYAYEYGARYDGSAVQIEHYHIREDEDFEIGDLIDDTAIAPHYCPFCQDELVGDDDLLNYLLRKVGLTKDAAVSEYRSRREEEL